MATKVRTTELKKKPVSRLGLPTTMRAAAIDQFGEPGVLTIHTLPVPTPGPHEVLIQVHAAGVGVWDAAMRRGEYADGTEKFPIVLGSDGAGIVAAHGADVPAVKYADLEVWASEYGNPKGGFYAEYVAVDVNHVGKLPPQLTLLEAGASCATGLTALQGIDDHIQLRERETILIFGATGAVGTLAVQFAAHHREAHVIGTASTAGGEQTIRDLGAEHVLDPREPNAAERLRSLAPHGLNAILALAGGAVLEQCADQLVAGGRLAYPNGVTPEPRKRDNVRVIAYDAVAGKEEFERLNRAVAEAHLQVVIAKTFKLEEAAQAHRLLERGHVIGRIVLQVR
jgi:NADPH:quinone reductase-like Zn-dependent oxidoreductase